MTDAELEAIEARSKAAMKAELALRMYADPLAEICRADVPALLAEVRRLREALGAALATHVRVECPTSYDDTVDNCTCTEPSAWREALK